MASRPTPSKKLLSAAHGEIERLQRARERTEQRRAAVLAEIAELDQALEGYARRLDLLDELIATPATPAPLLAGPRRATPPPPERSSAPDAVRGRELRRIAGHLLWSTERDGEIHYRDWFERAMTAGVAVGGKDPAASFLTNIRDSPAVTRGSRPGYYRLNPDAIEKTHQQIRETQAEFTDLEQTIEHIAPHGQDAEQLKRLRTHHHDLTRRLRRLHAEADELAYVFSDDQTTADPALPPPARLAA